MPNRAMTTRQAPPGAAAAETLRRDELIDAAIVLADREGLAALSIRRLAAALGRRPMSLYTYITGKEQLLELMAERVVGEVLIDEPLPRPWRTAVETIAHRSHQVFVAHPWLATVAPMRSHLGHNAVAHAEQLLNAIAPLNLSAAGAWQVLFLINDYTLGHAVRVAHAPRGPSADYPPFDAEQFPRLAAARDGAPVRDEDTFATGLRLLLDAIDASAQMCRSEDGDPPRAGS